MRRTGAVSLGIESSSTIIDLGMAHRDALVPVGEDATSEHEHAGGDGEVYAKTTRAIA